MFETTIQLKITIFLPENPSLPSIIFPFSSHMEPPSFKIPWIPQPPPASQGRHRATDFGLHVHRQGPSGAAGVALPRRGRRLVAILTLESPGIPGMGWDGAISMPISDI